MPVPIDQSLNIPDPFEGIDDVENAFVVTRENPNAPISTREYWCGPPQGWSNKIEDAKLYVDEEQAMNRRRVVAKNFNHFFQHKGYSIPTRFAYVRLGEIVKQLFQGDTDIVCLTQGLTASLYQPRRDFRDFAYPNNRD